MAELIEAVSSATLSDVDKLIDKLKNVNREIQNINSRPIGGAGGVSGDRQALAEIERLNRALADQQAAIQRLTETRTQSNQRTQEEITNQRLLAQNANRAALANSTFANSYQRLSAQQAIAATRVQDLIARGRTGEQTQRQYNRELRNAQREFDQLNTRVLSADRAVGRFNRNVGNYPGQAVKGLKDLIGAFGLVGGVTAFAMIAKDIFQTTKELQSLDLALKNVTGSEQALAETQEFLNRISESYGIEIKGLTRSYTGFLAASQNAIADGKITATQIQDIFESVSKASGAMGLSVEQQQGAFLALQQMISKGNVQAEEIRGQLAERLPGAFGILAKSMGVTEVELNKLLKDGKVLAAEVLPAFAKELEKAYGVENLERVESLAASTTRLGNAWTDLVRSFSEGDGIFSKVLIGLIEGIADATKGLELFFGTANNKANYQGAQIYNKTLQEQIEYYQQLNDLHLGEQRGRDQAAYDIPLIRKRIEELKNENIALEENMQVAKETADLAKRGLGMFSFGSNVEMRKIYAEMNDSIEEMTAKSTDNTLALSLNRAMLEAATKAAASDNTVKKESIQLSDKQLKALQKLREEELQNQYRLDQLRRKSQADTAQSMADDESLYIEQRLRAQQDATTIELERERKTLDNSLRLSKGNKTLQAIAWEEYYAKVRDIAEKGGKDIAKLQEEEFKRFDEWGKKYEGEGLKVLDTDDLASQFLEKQKEDAEKAAEAVKKLKEETDNYLKTFTEGFFADAGLPSLFKILNGEVAGFGENFATTFLAITEVAQEAFEFLSQNSQARFDAELSQLEREKEARLQFAGDSESGRAEIERQYEERRREIRRKEAEANKQQALFNIAINTAQGVVAALASVPPNVPLSIVIGAIGAAQLALVGSRQIPQYKDGTENHPGGYAVVGDGGKHEVVHQPSLGWSITPNKSTLIDLEKGSKVFPDLASSGILDSGVPDVVHLKGGGITASQMGKLFKQHMPKSTVNVQIGKGGLKTYVQSQSGSVEKLNNNVRFKA